MRRALLGLGSNVGDRRANLQAAVNALAAENVLPTAVSSVYDTDPVGEVLDQPSFLNACLFADTDLEPLALLDAASASSAISDEPSPRSGTARDRSTSTSCCSARSSSPTHG